MQNDGHRLEMAAVSAECDGPEARHRSVDHVLSNGFGFGGVNASVIFSRYR